MASITLLPSPVYAPLPISQASKTSALLNIKSHLVDYDSIVQLSAFDNLEDLCVKTTSSVPSDNRQTQDGFPSLKSLHIRAKVSEMPRILRLVCRGTLETLTFVDTSSEAFRTNLEFMMDIHRELVARFPLRNLSLPYQAARLGKALWASSRAVFEPMYELPRLHSIQFVGELAMDDETIKTSLAPSWPHIGSISIHQLSGDTPSYVVLSVLAKCCPRLVSLAMPIGFPDDGVLSAVEVLSHRLQILKSVDTTAKKPVLIARFLDRIFPFLVCVEGGSGFNEVDSILRDSLLGKTIRHLKASSSFVQFHPEVPWLRLVVSPAPLHMHKLDLNARRMVSGFCYIVLGIFEPLRAYPRVLYVDIHCHHVLSSSTLTRYGECFPGTGTQENKGRGKGKDNVLLKDGITDESSQSIFEPVVDKILEVFQPNAVVLQCGADSLGRQTRLLKSHDARTCPLRPAGTPSTYETACALGIEDTIDPNLPWNEYFEWFGPRYRLEVVTSNMEDMNVKDGSLEQVRINALEHLRELNGVPSVGMHDVPKESLLEHLGFGKESDTQDKLDERLARKSPSFFDELPTREHTRLQEHTRFVYKLQESDTVSSSSDDKLWD
ncbi:hypothetical protein EV421DRAFT_1909892 [Armillaria borealis]|uniref:Histone deacetylase domain-containing protein n=1 Tax=Armillaria borealis TaxID=47425 RepID=A0AA39MGR1_9AGAR|nr:hypothetical protein EV421DRAFT_1909892 [Armillaria borealis]